MADVFVRFVNSAPHRDRRTRIFSALDLYVEQALRVLPGTRFWVDGGFVTHKTEAPKDVDVVMVVDRATVGTVSLDDLAPLLTFQGGTAQALGLTLTFGRLQPFGGLVDGFLAFHDDPNQLHYWHNQWSGVKGEPTAVKGYLEVTR